MGYPLKQGQTAQPLTFFLTLSSDHVTGATGKAGTVAVKIRKVGGSSVTPSGAITEVDATNMPGWYEVAGHATDSNTLGPVLLHASVTACDPYDDLFLVVAYDPLAAAGLGLTNLDAATSTRASQTSVDAVDDLLDTEVAAIKTDTAAIKLKTDNLPAAPAAVGDIPTAAVISDAVWDEVQSGHVTAGTFGKYLDDEISDVSAGGGSTDWTADERTAIRTILGVPASGTTPDVPTAGALKVIDDYLDTEVSSLATSVSDVATTIGVAGAGLTALASQSSLNTLDDLVDTEVAAIKADTAAIKLKTDNLPASPAATGDIPSASTIAIAVRDVNNTTPAVDSLGSTVNASASGGLDPQDVADLVIAGIGDGGGGGATASEVAALILVTPANKLATDASGRVTGAADLINAIPMTLTAAPTNFREWIVWLTLRFRRTRFVKATQIISVYGSDGSTVVTNQTTTDNSTQSTVSAVE